MCISKAEQKFHKSIIGRTEVNRLWKIKVQFEKFGSKFVMLQTFCNDLVNVSSLAIGFFFSNKNLKQSGHQNIKLQLRAENCNFCRKLKHQFSSTQTILPIERTPRKSNQPMLHKCNYCWKMIGKHTAVVVVIIGSKKKKKRKNCIEFATNAPLHGHLKYFLANEWNKAWITASQNTG